MEINDYGQVVVTEQEAFEALYAGKINHCEHLFFTDENLVNSFNQSRAQNADRFPDLTPLIKLDQTLEEFDKSNQCDWFMPRDAVDENLVEMLYGMCKTEEQTARVSEELTLFIQHGMMDLLFYLKYLVDTLRKEQVLWGVGRGSSVASYVLYLIGVHKIDSIKYNLDIREFLK